MTMHSAHQVTMNRHCSILQASKPVWPVKQLHDQRHIRFPWVSCLDIVPFLSAFGFFVDMVKKARCLPCDFFFKFWSSGAGGEIREANEKEEDLQAIQATRIEEGKLQPIKQSNWCQLLHSISSATPCEDLMKLRVSKAIRKAERSYCHWIVDWKRVDIIWTGSLTSFVKSWDAKDLCLESQEIHRFDGFFLTLTRFFVADLSNFVYNFQGWDKHHLDRERPCHEAGGPWLGRQNNGWPDWQEWCGT